MSSGASVSSFGSSADASTAGQLRPSALTPDGDGDAIFEETHTLQLGVFGVLYTVSKEKQLTSVKFAFFRLFLDFLQLWLLVVNPSYGWAINAKNRAWQVVSFIQLNAFLSARGYVFFLALLYVFIGLLGVNLALSMWVANAFSNNRFEYVWPIQFLRWFGLIFYQVLDIATLTLLLVTLDCNYFNVSSEVRFHNQEFPDVMCWSMPHIVHVAVSVASIVLFFIMATCQVVSDMELNPLTRNYMAIAHTRVEGVGFAIKAVVTIASVTIATSVKALALVYLFFFAMLFYLAVKWVPFVYSALNYVRCASYGTVLYSSVLLVVLAFGPSDSSGEHEQFRERITWALWAGMGPAAVAGALACHMRLRHFNRTILDRFRDAEPGASSKTIYRFADAREVEIAARCCRRWVDEDTLEPEAVELSEQVIKAGMLQMPQDAQMIILYSSFLIDVQGSYQSGYTQLQTAKKQSTSVLERFAIFSREQEHTQKSSGANGGGDSAVDLVSYVEFQRNHRLVVRAHREALLAMRSFWGLLLRNNVNFNHLSKALHRIEVSVKAAERAYRGVLSRHASSARLVRLYGRFLETVKFDPWAASKWYTEADRLEEDAEHTKEALQLGGMENLLPQGSERGLAEMEGVAFMCINAQSIIQVASPEASAMLGYSKNELKGKDVGIIMPPPFGDRHAAYVRNYIQNAGTAGLLDRNTDVVVVTKARVVLAVRLHVTKVSGLNEDSIFMGIMEALPPSPDEARAWILGNGVITAADARFCDWLGYDGAELPGMALESLVLEPEPIRDAVKGFSRLHAAAAGLHNRLAHRRSSNFADQLAPTVPSLLTGKNDSKINTGGDGKASWIRPSSNSLDRSKPSMLATALSHILHGGNAHGAAGAAAGDMPVRRAAPAVLSRTAWRHKYNAPLAFDTFLQPGGFGSVKVHSIIIRRCAPAATATSTGAVEPPTAVSSASPFSNKAMATAAAVPRVAPSLRYDDLLLVCDIKGHVLHVTAALAEALGRSAESIRSGGLGLLIPEPASILHGPWLQELGNPMSHGSGALGTAPPYSCRSGVAVSLATYSEQNGPGVRPFRLNVTQRLAEGGGSKIHVVSLTPLSPEQALSERRLRLSVDLSGTILSADGDTPKELFGADPRVLPGRSVTQLIDLFRPDALDDILLGSQAATPHSPMHIRRAPSTASAPGLVAAGASGADVRAVAAGGDLLEGAAVIAKAAFARRLSKALLELAKRDSEGPGCSWRVGVHVPPDEEDQEELAQLAGLLGPESVDLANQFLGAKTVPAVMRVRLVRRQRQAPMAPSVSSSANGMAGSASGTLWHLSSRLAPEKQATGGNLLLKSAPVAEAAAEDTETQQIEDAQAPAPRGGARGGRRGHRGRGRPVAEATEQGLAGQEPSPSVLDSEDVAALDELAETIEEDLSPPPPVAPASSAAAALAAAVAAAAGKPRQDSRTPEASQQGYVLADRPEYGRVAPTTHRPSGAMAPPSPALAPPPLAEGPNTPSTPRSMSPAAVAASVKSPVHQLAFPTPPSPRPADLAWNAPVGALAGVRDMPESEPRPSLSRHGLAGLGKPVSLRLPPEAAARVAATLAKEVTVDAPPMPLPAPAAARTTSVAPAAAAPAAGLVPSLTLEIELWRADLLSGVLEVDERGRVLRADGNCPMANTGLVLGAAPGSLANASASDYVPLPSGGVAALLDSAPGDPGAVRGALKKRVTKQAKAGAPTLLAARHHGDGCELALTVQAVRRAGPSGSAFLILRPSAPTTAQPGFMRWLYHGDVSGLLAPHGSADAADECGSRVAAPPSYTSLGLGAASGGGAGSVERAPGLPTAVPLEPGHTTAAAVEHPRAGGGEAAATTAPKYATRKASTLTGLTSMALVDRASGGAPLSSGLPHSYSATGIGSFDARHGQPNTGQRPAIAAFFMGSGGLPPPPPVAIVPLSIDPAVSAMRIAAARGVAANANNPAGPSRLSITSVPVPADEPGEPQGAVGGELQAAPRKSTSTGISSVVPDTAYEQSSRQLGADVAPHGPTHRFPSLESGSGLMAAAALEDAAVATLPGVVTPRQSASLQGEAEPLNVSPSSKLNAKKHNMVHSWVLSGHGPGAMEHHGHEGAMPPGAQHALGGIPADQSDAGSEGSHAAGDAASADGGDGGSSDGGGRPAGAGKPHRGAPGSDSGRDGATDPEVESEAGAVVANYSVGKRFKKLHKILTSPLAQQPSRRLKWQAIGTVGTILAAHTITFILLLTQLLEQQAAVTDLNSVAMACRRVHEIAIDGRMLEQLYSGNSYVEGVPQFGDPYEDAVSELYDDLHVIMDSMKELHHGVYLGFRSLRRIATDFGLRDIWDNPTLNITIFYDANDPEDLGTILSSGDEPSPTAMQLGLWDAGNLYLAKALEMHNNGPHIVQQGANFTTWSVWQFIHANGLPVIFPAYEATLEALVELTVAKSKSIYNLQLIVLCLEGCLLCFIACVYMWYSAGKFSQRRYSLYGVFIQIPLGVTRGLANMSLKLEANEEDEEEEGGLTTHEALATDNHGGVTGGGGGETFLTDGVVKAAASGHLQGEGVVATKPSQRRRNSILNFSIKLSGAIAPGDEEGGDHGGAATGVAAGDGGRRGWHIRGLSQGLGALAFWRSRAKVNPQGKLGGKTKRRLMPSQRLAYSLVAPFIVWGIAVIAVNLVGYHDLKAMTAPIAILNVVNEVLIRAHRIIYYVLEVAGAFTQEASGFYKSILASELATLLLEYSAMLYGNEAAHGLDSPHLRLATTGVVFGGFRRPSELLYNTGSCLCTDPEACQPLNSSLYEVTHNGLDILMKTQFGFVSSLVLQPAETSGMNSTEFRSLWATGQTDMEGGVSKLSAIFLDEVQGSYNKVVVQQIAMFAIGWVWGLFFLALQLRPLLRRTHSEMRRIAELLSQLPGEVDCEALVTAVILGEQGNAMPAGAGRPGGAGGPAAGNGAGSGNAYVGGNSNKFGRISEPGQAIGPGFNRLGVSSRSGHSPEYGLPSGGSVKMRTSATGYAKAADN